LRIGRHQLQPVPERIGNVETPETAKRLVDDQLDAGVEETGLEGIEGIEIVDDQGGVGLTSRRKTLLNSEMDTHLSRLEPAAAPRLEMRGLCDSRDSEEALVEHNGGLLFTSWHRELDVVNPDYCHPESITGKSKEPTAPSVSSERM
jgi:hypothetical protein